MTDLKIEDENDLVQSIEDISKDDSDITSIEFKSGYFLNSDVDDFSIFTNIIANNHSLKELTISTFIYKNYFMLLLKGLIDNNSINNINFIECLGGYINDNKVSDALVKAFAKDNINKIDLSYNEMGLCGAKIIANVLRRTKSITHIDLKGNEMGASAAMELAEALEYNNITTSIELDKNNIKPERIEAINILLNRNREYLSRALEDLFAGSNLNITQYNTIKSHYAMLKENSLSYIPAEMRERISQDPEHLMEILRSFESKTSNVTSEMDAKADILLRSLKEDITITNLSNTGLEENNIAQIELMP
jgi:hypothetical protein